MSGAAAAARLPAGVAPPVPPAWRAVDAAWLGLALAIAALAHVEVLRCFFFADDFLYLFRLNDAPFGEFFLAPNAGHLLIFRNLLFLLTWKLFGTDPQGFYASVLLTHLLNVGLLFVIVRDLTASTGLAGVAAAWWGSLAVHAPTLAWYAVYGQVVAVTLLAGFWLLARAHRAPPSPAVRALLAGLLFAAGSSFGSALAVVVVTPLALLILRPQWRRGRLPPFSLVVLVLLALWLGSQVAYADQDAEQLTRLLTPYDPALRAATKSGPLPVLRGFRELYLFPQAALMGLDLLGHGLRAITLGPYAVSPWTGNGLGRVLLALFAVGALLALRALPPARRRVALALALLLGAAYASIAIGRARIYLTILHGSMPLLVDRYHYLPSFLLTVLLVLLAEPLRARLRSLALRRGAAGLAVAGLVAVLVARPIPHERNDVLRARVHEAIDGIAQAAATGSGELVIPNRPVNLMWMGPQQSFPGLAGLFVIYFPTNSVAGRRVLFAETNPAVLAAARRGRRTHNLFTAGDAVDPAAS